MFKKIINFFALILFVLKLLIASFIFALEYCCLKIRLNKYAVPAIILIILLVNAYNWQLWQKKSQIKIVAVDAVSQHAGEILSLLSYEEIQSLKKYYLELEAQQENSRDINFNLAKIFELEDNALAKEKFARAKKLDPNFP